MDRREPVMGYYEEKPRKVHMFKDQKGATYGAYGKQHLYADTLCRSNFRSPNLLTTDDPVKVTCTSCRKKMLKEVGEQFTTKKPVVVQIAKALNEDFWLNPVANTLALVLLLAAFYSYNKGDLMHGDHALILSFLALNGRSQRVSS